MKKLFSFLFLISFSAMAYSQIVIDSLYMPEPGQIIPRKSTADLGSLNYTATDSAFTWDFRALVPLQQKGDTFVNITSTNLVYLAVYYMATVASPQALPTVPMVTISDPFYFYKNTYTRFSLLGMAGKINGIPMPVKFDNPDVWYNFPLTFGNIDSSHSAFNVNIPNLGYYGQDRRRTNEVDGWGTLYLPTDTFDVVRVKSTIHYKDTIHSDSLGFGMKFNRTEIEYKWLSQEYSVPVLQITEATGGMGPSTTTAVFIDHSVLPNAISENKIKNTIDIMPNPSDGHFTISLADAAMDSPVITIYNINGQKIISPNFKKDDKLSIDISDQPAGLYLLQICSNGKLISKKVMIY